MKISTLKRISELFGGPPYTNRNRTFDSYSHHSFPRQPAILDMDPMHHVPAVQHHVPWPAQRHEEGPLGPVSGVSVCEAGSVDPQAAALHLGPWSSYMLIYWWFSGNMMGI